MFFCRNLLVLLLCLYVVVWSKPGVSRTSSGGSRSGGSRSSSSGGSRTSASGGSKTGSSSNSGSSRSTGSKPSSTGGSRGTGSSGSSTGTKPKPAATGIFAGSGSTSSGNTRTSGSSSGSSPTGTGNTRTAGTGSTSGGSLSSGTLNTGGTQTGSISPGSASGTNAALKPSPGVSGNQPGSTNSGSLPGARQPSAPISNSQSGGTNPGPVQQPGSNLQTGGANLGPNTVLQPSIGSKPTAQGNSGWFGNANPSSPTGSNLQPQPVVPGRQGVSPGGLKPAGSGSTGWFGGNNNRLPPVSTSFLSNGANTRFPVANSRQYSPVNTGTRYITVTSGYSSVVTVRPVPIPVHVRTVYFYNRPYYYGPRYYRPYQEQSSTTVINNYNSLNRNNNTAASNKTCSYELTNEEVMKYDDNTTVNQIIFECKPNEICCGLDCCDADSLGVLDAPANGTVSVAASSGNITAVPTFIAPAAIAK